jgi:putative ATP-binding cassette transporter
MSLVWSLVRSSRLELAALLLASMLSGLGVALLVALINQSLSAPASELPRLGVQFACVSVAMLGFRWFSLSRFIQLGQVTLARLRLHVSTHIAEAPYREIEAHGAARLLAVLTEDIARVGESIVMLPRLVVHGVVLLGCLAYLAFLSWQLFALGLVLIALASLGYYKQASLASEHLRRARRGEDDVHRDFRALFSGAKELRLHGPRRTSFVEDLTAHVETVRAARTRGLHLHVATVSARMFLLFGAIGAVVFVRGGVLDIPHDVRSGYALMLLYMMLPLHALFEAMPALGRARVALEQLQAIGADAPATPPTVLAELVREPFEQLTLRDVTHSYQRDNEAGVFAFGPVRLELVPSEVVFVVGGNGSGKTTLAKLLVGLYAPERGKVLLNGREIGDVAGWDAYRQSFSAVFQDFHLFESLLGIDSQGLDERGLALLRALDLEHKVVIRDGVFSTTELSSGQQKRLALLVACLEDRPVYVFDEWTADQDPAYREVFYRQVLPALKARGKAVFVITHDDRYFHLADRLLRLDAGKLRPLSSLQLRPASRALALAGES